MSQNHPIFNLPQIFSFLLSVCVDPEMLKLSKSSRHETNKIRHQSLGRARKQCPEFAFRMADIRDITDGIANHIIRENNISNDKK